MYYFFFKVRFSKSRAQGLSPPSNEDNNVAKNEGFILTPRVLFGSFFPILGDLSLFLRVGAFSWMPCFVLLIPRRNAPYLVPGFSGKKQPRRQCLLESEKTLGTRVGGKMGCGFPSSVNLRRLIHLRRIKIRQIMRPNWKSFRFLI